MIRLSPADRERAHKLSKPGEASHECVHVQSAGLLGRILLVAIFIGSGWGKIGGYEAASAAMDKAGAPGTLLPLVIIVELLGGILIVIGGKRGLPPSRSPVSACWPPISSTST